MQQMWFPLTGAGMGFLILHSLTDLKKKRIYLPLALLQITVGMGLCALWGRLPSPAAFLPGGAAFVIARCSREALGEGDAWVLLASGCFFPPSRLLWGIEGSFGLLWLHLAVKRPRSRREEIPYIPFLTVGMIGGLLIHA